VFGWQHRRSRGPEARSDLTRGRKRVVSGRVLVRRRPVQRHTVRLRRNSPATGRASSEAARRVQRLQRTVAIARFAGQRSDHALFAFRSCFQPARFDVGTARGSCDTRMSDVRVSLHAWESASASEPPAGGTPGTRARQYSKTTPSARFSQSATGRRARLATLRRAHHRLARRQRVGCRKECRRTSLGGIPLGDAYARCLRALPRFRRGLLPPSAAGQWDVGRQEAVWARRAAPTPPRSSA
jgi:hypothetical protein